MIESNQICFSQGYKDRSLVPMSGMVTFLNDKLLSAIGEKRSKKATTTSELEEGSAFKYLEKVNIETDDFGEIKAELEAKYGLCRMKKAGGSYPQVKIPSVVVPGNGIKACGYMTVQAVGLSICLYDGVGTDCKLVDIQTLLERLKGYGAARLHGAHLCKQKCVTRGHVVLIPNQYNTLDHETCLGYVLFRGKAYNMCRCRPKTGPRCFAPGVQCDLELVKEVYGRTFNAIIEDCKK